MKQISAKMQDKERRTTVGMQIKYGLPIIKSYSHFSLSNHNS